MIEKKQFIISKLNEGLNTLNLFLNDESNVHQIEKAINLITNSIINNNKVISFGNGGSMCDAMHFAQELTGKFNRDRSSIPAIAISDPSYITCTGNDYGFHEIFSRAVKGLGKHGDSILAISTSGNSENVINGVKSAKSLGFDTIALLGNDGGKIKDYCDVPIIIPCNNTARIQEVHINIIHIIIEAVENEIFF